MTKAMTRSNPLWKYAGMLAKHICFPSNGPNMDLLAKAIQTEIDYSRASPEVAVRFIANEVFRDRNERGETIDKWYFTDGRWRNKRLSKAEQFSLRNRVAIEGGLWMIREAQARAEARHTTLQEEIFSQFSEEAS